MHLTLRTALLFYALGGEMQDTLSPWIAELGFWLLVPGTNKRLRKIQWVTGTRRCFASCEESASNYFVEKAESLNAALFSVRLEGIDAEKEVD